MKMINTVVDDMYAICYMLYVFSVLYHHQQILARNLTIHWSFAVVVFTPRCRDFGTTMGVQDDRKFGIFLFTATLVAFIYITLWLLVTVRCRRHHHHRTAIR